MVLYSCPRCLYNTKQRRDIRKHFQRKNPCRIVAEHISIEECVKAVLGNESEKNLKVPQFPSKSLKKTLKNPQNLRETLNFSENSSKKLLNSGENPRRFYSDSENSSVNSSEELGLENEKNLNLRETLKFPQFSPPKNTETISGGYLREIHTTQPNIIRNSPDKSKDIFYKCKYCPKTYSRKDNLVRHTKICKHRLAEIESENNDISELIMLNNNSNKMVSFDEVKKLLEAERQREREKSEFIITELKSQIEVLLKNQGSNNTHTTNYNIMINSFGKENLDYISNDYINQLINSGPINSIPTLLKYIHFNPEHKENHNVKISNKKENYAQIFNGSDWEYRDKRATISDMSDRAYNILNIHYKNGNNAYMDDFKEQYEENNKIVHRRVFKDTELMILNNQKLFC